jgi:hypothetical protein
MAIGLQTFDDTSRREDLISLLKDISPLGGNYLYSNLGQSSAQQTVHQWPILHISRATSVTFKAEGADATVVDHTAPTRSDNVTAILSRVVQVTGTESEVSTATGRDPMAHQKEIAMKQLVQDIEFALVNGAKVSGSSGVARGMAGLDGVISSNVTARSSGTSMSVTELEDIMQSVWDNVDGGFMGKTLLVPMGVARKISGFTTNITNYVNETDKVYRNIKTFQGSTGEIKIVPHKDVRKTGGTASVYLINEDMFRVSYLRKPKWQPLAVSGDYEKGQYITELTLESLAEKSSAKRTGYRIEAD